MQTHQILRLTTAAGETALAIPFLGGLFIIGFIWTPLLIMLILHIVTLVICVNENKPYNGNIIGIIASVVGWVPFIGFFLHVISAVFIWIDISKEKDFYDKIKNSFHTPSPKKQETKPLNKSKEKEDIKDFLIKSDFLKFTKPEHKEKALSDITSSFKKHGDLNFSDMDEETSITFDGRQGLYDAETIFELGGVSSYLEEEETKAYFKNLGLELNLDSENDNEENGEYQKTIKLNGKEFEIYKGKSENPNGWSIATKNFLIALNSISKDKIPGEKFYIYEGDFIVVLNEKIKDRILAESKKGTLFSENGEI